VLNHNSKAALKRVLASLLGMGRTRMQLAGVELAQARQQAVRTVIWSLLCALSGAFASLFVCVLVIALAWDTHRIAAIVGSVVFYVLMGVYFYLRVQSETARQPDVFEATLAELERDRQAILDSLLADRNHRGDS
jgi:uncharacterized membrane protein YqjE